MTQIPTSPDDTPWHRIVSRVDEALAAISVGDAATDAVRDGIFDDTLLPNESLPGDLAGGVDPKIVAECALLDQSDTDNAARLCAHFGADLVVMAQDGVGGGDWAGWCGTHWNLADGAAHAVNTAKKVGGRIALEAEWLAQTPSEKSAIDAAKALKADDDSDEAEDIRDAAEDAKAALKSRKLSRRKFAVSSKNNGRIKSMLDLAAPDLRRPIDAFNADPYRVACRSHTLRFAPDIEPDPDTDGRTKTWGVVATNSHAREDYITALVPVDWSPNAAAPKWHAFLERMLVREDVRRTVQQYCGTGLLGILLQRVMFHYGNGANGKSVFLETITQVLGASFAIGLPPESISGKSERSAGGAAPDIARLLGKRMVRVLELPEGKPLHEDLIKRLTGGEQFPVRTLFKGYFEFASAATPHMSGNGFPTIDGADEGIWRRMLVVHWDQTIPEGERREFAEVVDELVREESAGIFAWLVEGALDFLRHGLVVAEGVRSATKAYREDMDPIGEFAAVCTRASPGSRIGAADMFKAYQAWSHANAKRERSQAKFGREMVKRYRRDDTNARRYYIDVEIFNVPSARSRLDEPADVDVGADGP